LRGWKRGRGVWAGIGEALRKRIFFRKNSKNSGKGNPVTTLCPKYQQKKKKKCASAGGCLRRIRKEKEKISGIEEKEGGVATGGSTFRNY